MLVARAAKSLLRSRHRDALAPFGPASAEDLATATGLLAGAEAMGALAALVVRLVGALHGVPSCSCQGSGKGKVGIDTRRQPRSQGRAFESRSGDCFGSRTTLRSPAKFRSSLG